MLHRGPTGAVEAPTPSKAHSPATDTEMSNSVEMARLRESVVAGAGFLRQAKIVRQAKIELTKTSRAKTNSPTQAVLSRRKFSCRCGV